MIDGNIVYGMCRYNNETKLSKENALLKKKLEMLKFRIIKIEITMRNIELYSKAQKNQCEMEKEKILQKCLLQIGRC